MFHGCTSIKYLNLSNFKTDNVINMPRMFGYCSNLKELDISNFNFDKAQLPINFFKNCFSLEKVNIPKYSNAIILKLKNILLKLKKE